MPLQPVLTRRLPSRPPLFSLTPTASASAAARRPFFSLFGDANGRDSAPKVLVATRTLPYAPWPIYNLIVDIDSYHRFLPYCHDSRVTHWSNRDANGRCFPTRAELQVGWGSFKETFTSHVNCIAPESVEARSGGSDKATSSSVLDTLVTRWSLKPGPAFTSEAPSTEIQLSVTYRFANPLYEAVSDVVSNDVADYMIQAFEKQAREKLHPKSEPSPPS